MRRSHQGVWIVCATTFNAPFSVWPAGLTCTRLDRRATELSAEQIVTAVSAGRGARVWSMPSFLKTFPTSKTFLRCRNERSRNPPNWIGFLDFETVSQNVDDFDQLIDLCVMQHEMM